MADNSRSFPHFAVARSIRSSCTQKQICRASKQLPNGVKHVEFNSFIVPLISIFESALIVITMIIADSKRNLTGTRVTKELEAGEMLCCQPGLVWMANLTASGRLNDRKENKTQNEMLSARREHLVLTDWSAVNGRPVSSSSAAISESRHQLPPSGHEQTAASPTGGTLRWVYYRKDFHRMSHG